MWAHTHLRPGPLEMLSGTHSAFWLAWMHSFYPALIQEFILHAPLTPECTCAEERGKFQFSLLLEEKCYPLSPPTPHTLSLTSPFYILIVSICHTSSVSTGSDVMTWCNDALEHFLQKKYISVQMLDWTAIWKENNKVWSHIPVMCTDILYNIESQDEITVKGCDFRR